MPPKIPVAPMMEGPPNQAAPNALAMPGNKSSGEPSQGEQEEQAQEQPIPHLPHIGPSIFVPLPEDLDITKPTAENLTRVDLVKRKLESVEFHKRGVRANFHHLVDHQSKRAMQRFRWHEEQHGAEAKAGTGLLLEEEEGIIACIRAPPDPNVEYNIATDDFQMHWLFKSDDETPNRPNTMRMLQELVEFGVSRIEGYNNNHIAAVRQKWEQTLEKEERALEGFGRSTDSNRAPEEDAGDGTLDW